ncbi:hypothetical protein D3C73_1195110 [compost metagenome]
MPGDLQVGFRALIKGPGHELGGDQGFLAGKFLLVEVRRRFRRLQFSLLLAIAGLEPVDTQPRHAELRLGTFDGDLEGLRVDPEQHLALVDLLVVLDGDFHHLPGNPRVDRGLRHPGVGVIGRNIRLPRHVVGITQRREEDGHTDHQPWAQPLFEWFADRRVSRVGARVLEGLRSRDIERFGHDRVHL